MRLAIVGALLLAIANAGCLPAAGCDLTMTLTDDPSLAALPVDAVPEVVAADVDPDGWRVEPDDGSGAGDLVVLRLRDDAADRFAELTAANVGRYLAIAVDGRVVAVPVIQAPIEDGEIALSLASSDTSGFASCLPVDLVPRP
jgi:hypothetical protein